MYCRSWYNNNRICPGREVVLINGTILPRGWIFVRPSNPINTSWCTIHHFPVGFVCFRSVFYNHITCGKYQKISHNAGKNNHVTYVKRAWCRLFTYIKGKLNFMRTSSVFIFPVLISKREWLNMIALCYWFGVSFENFITRTEKGNLVWRIGVRFNIN